MIVGGILYFKIPIFKLLFGIIGFSVIFFGLLKFTIVQEGTAKAILTFGKFRKMVMSWKDWEFDENWNVVPGKKFHLGGLRIVGIRGIHNVYRYKFRWTDISIKEGKEIIEPHEKEIDYIFVRPHLYISLLSDIETQDLIPTTTRWTFIVKVVNPYKALFAVPVNWLEKLIGLIHPILRSYIVATKIGDLLRAQRESIEFLEAHEELNRIKTEIKENWGIEIISIKLREVEAPGYRKAIARKAEMEYEAKGRAERIMGSIIQSVARATGKSNEEVQRSFKRNPKEFYEKHKPLIDNIMSTISMEERAYLRIETPGATGVLGDFLKLVAVWQRTPRGEPKRKPATERLSKRKKVEEMTLEELEEEAGLK